MLQGARYHITNEALVGACYLPLGLGNIGPSSFMHPEGFQSSQCIVVGASFAGRISDTIVVRWRKRRGGVWVPEDRLRATLGGALILVPMSVLGSGLATQFVEGRLGLIINLVCFFANGIGVSAHPLHFFSDANLTPQVDMVLSPSAAYGVDIMHSRSAEMLAANKLVSLSHRY